MASHNQVGHFIFCSGFFETNLHGTQWKSLVSLPDPKEGEKAKVCAKVSEKEFGTNFSLGKTGGESRKWLLLGRGKTRPDQTIVVLINTTRKKRGDHSGAIIFLVRYLS